RQLAGEGGRPAGCGGTRRGGRGRARISLSVRLPWHVACCFHRSWPEAFAPDHCLEWPAPDLRTQWPKVRHAPIAMVVPVSRLVQDMEAMVTPKVFHRNSVPRRSGS